MAYGTVPFHGKVARIEKGDTAMEFSEGWNISANVAYASTDRQSQNWAESLPGMASWSGSFSGQLVLGNTQQVAFVNNIATATPGVKLTDVKFLLDAGTNAYTGNIFIESHSVSAAVSDVVKFTFNFRGDGALSITSAA